MKKLQIKKIISFIPAFAIMLCIFLFSAQDSAESSDISGTVSYSIVSGFDKIFNLRLTLVELNTTAESIHNFIRKLAHFSEYFVLGISLILPINNILHKIKPAAIFSVILCSLYAVSDEIHQLFVPGRCGSPKDVFIDSIGGICGVLIIFEFTKIKLKHFSDNHI